MLEGRVRYIRVDEWMGVIVVVVVRNGCVSIGCGLRQVLVLSLVSVGEFSIRALLMY